MKLVNKNLEDWLKKPPTNNKVLKKGDTTPFYSKYDSFKEYISTLHGEVERGSLLNDLKNESEKNGTFDFDAVTLLNDHGPIHISTVIERATHLLNNNLSELNVREIFILLNAIQLHDVGNFYGRLGHEQKIKEVLKNGLPIIAFDTIESNYIKSVAQVHGGVKLDKFGNIDKGVISDIKDVVTSDGYTIRQRLLASLLRFADEIADDRHRAAINLLKEKKLPRGSEIFHAYSACLDTVLIKHEIKTVEYHFKVPKEFAIEKFGKINKDKGIIDEVFLIDEIYKRAIKTHEEKVYCSKFWKNNVDLEKIWVQIEFYHASEIGEFIHPDITFTIEDNYYPQQSNIDIYTLCPNLIVDGIPLDGNRVKNNINRPANG